MIKHLYLHIPFCLKKCNYCAFCSFNMLSKKDIYLEALNKEIDFYYKNELQKTIYFGGGTPSLLDTSDIENILSKINFDNKTEITLEINPYQISFEKLKDLKSIGINRISVGVQSFNDEILKDIGRMHTKNDIFKTLENIKKAGFTNCSIDLMYGLNNQDLKEWENNLKIALGLSVEHISLYGLKIEDGTYFNKFPPKNLPNSDMQADMYELAIEILKEKYKHYEFSNFALKSKNDYASKHNLCYWTRKNYYGFGLSASGFIDNKRYTNTFNFSEYIKNPLKKEYEILTKNQEIEEEIFLGLRLQAGINLAKLSEKYNIDVYQKYQKQFDKFLKQGFMEKTKTGFRLTLKGILVSNEILCEFL